jgi:tetratricopeptide (TPR) repeat protein
MLDCERQLTLEKRKAERIKLRRWTIDIFASSSSSLRSTLVCSPSKEIPVPALVSRVARKSIEQSDDISIYQAIQLVQALKRKAEQKFASKNYNSALLTSTNAIDAAEEAKNKAGSIMLQLAAVTIMTACSIRAATCYLKLDRCDEAEEIAGRAIVMIGNALEPKLDESMNTCTRASKTSTGDRHPYNFGGWRVKSFLVLARVSIRMQKYEDAIQILNNAHVVIAKYTASDYSKKTLPKVLTGCLLSSEEDDRISISLGKELQEPELSEGIQVTQISLGSSPCVSIDDEETVQPSCAVKRIAGLILDESLPKRTKKEELAHDVLDSSLLATDSEDEDEVEEKHGDQQEISQVWASVVKESGMPPNGPDGKGPVEVLDPELIFSVSRSAGEKANNYVLSDCPSLGSTTSFDSLLSSDRESTYYRGDTGTSMSPGSPGGPARRVTFSPSPPQVREYERYDIERKQRSSPDNGTSIQFNNLNKKCRMLKKNLDELNSFGVRAAVPVQGTQTVTRFAKQLGMSLLLMNAFVLTQRR